MSVMRAMEGPIGVAFLTMVTVLIIVLVVAVCRRFCCKPAVNYTAVNHGLDEEEIAFKKSMEAQHGDDIDELFNFSGREELDFDTDDLDNLELPQIYRSHLGLPSTTPGAVETGLGKEDRNGRGRDNGGVGGATEGSGGGAGASLGDAVREAEDLEALLDGGGCFDHGRGRGAGGGEMSGKGTVGDGNSGSGMHGPA